MRVTRNKIVVMIFAVTLVATAFLAIAAPTSEVHTPALSNRLVSVQQLPDMCNTGLTPADVWAIQQLSPPRQPEVQMAALAKPELQQNRPPAAAAGAPRANKTLQPIRTIRDADPTYSAIGL